MLEIAETSNINEMDLVAAYQRAVLEHEEGNNKITVGDLFRVWAPLRKTSGLRDFKAKIMDKMVEIGPAEEPKECLRSIAFGEKVDKFLYAQNHAKSLLAELRA